MDVGAFCCEAPQSSSKNLFTAAETPVWIGLWKGCKRQISAFILVLELSTSTWKLLAQKDLPFLITT